MEAVGWREVGELEGLDWGGHGVCVVLLMPCLQVLSFSASMGR